MALTSNKILYKFKNIGVSKWIVIFICLGGMKVNDANELNGCPINVVALDDADKDTF